MSHKFFLKKYIDDKSKEFATRGKISIHVQAKEKKDRENINGFNIPVLLLEYNFYGKDILSIYPRGVKSTTQKKKKLKKNLTIPECSDDLHNFWVHAVICQLL